MGQRRQKVNPMSNRFLTVLRQSGGKFLVRGGLVIGLLIAIGYFANSIDFEETFKALPFSNDPDAPWYRGVVGYSLLGALAICVSCPRQVVSFFAAYFFGLWTGLAAALFAAITACIITYFGARIFQERVRGFIRGKLDIAVTFWRDNTFFATMIWRFMPAGSNLLTNLAAGALGIPAVSFILGSAIGYVPQTMIFVFVGSGVRVESGTQLLVSGILFVLSVILGLFLLARYRKKLKQSDQTSSV